MDKYMIGIIDDEETAISKIRGVIKENEATINMPIARSKTDRKKMAVDKNGKNAITHFKVLGRFKEKYTLLQINIETGRTHQIRVHSAFMGYPLLGDDLYGEASPLISRQALHCEKMTFQSPENGRIVTVTAPLPEDMLCLMTPDR